MIVAGNTSDGEREEGLSASVLRGFGVLDRMAACSRWAGPAPARLKGDVYEKCGLIPPIKAHLLEV